jgi:Cys-rich repeat protein
MIFHTVNGYCFAIGLRARGTGMPVLRRFAIAGICVAFALLACTSAPDSKGQCGSNADCAEGFVCSSHVCVNPTKLRCGEKPSCRYDLDCASGSCQDGCCLPPCTSDSECGLTESCIDGACRVPPSDNCLSDEDCTNPNAAHCEVQTGTCSRCLEDAHCPDDFICENFGCKEKPKTGCIADADCPEITPRCLKEEQKCVVCLVDGHCARDGTAVCDPDRHVCQAVKTGCDLDFDCEGTPATPHCRTSDRTCVICAKDDHCPSGERCISDFTCGGPASCADKTDCAAPTSKCDTSKRTCVECLNDTECGPAKSCINNACVMTGCLNDTHCSAPNPRCLRANYTCVECMMNLDCAFGSTCKNNKCEGCSSDADCTGIPGMPVCNVAKKTCVQCTALFDSRCKSPLFCDPSLQLCTGCGSDFECQYIYQVPGAPRCDAVTTACVQCTKDSHCAAGKTCKGGVCQ